MRCFIAVDLAEDLKKGVIKLQDKLKGVANTINKDNLHFTLKFLGEVDEKTVKSIKPRLKQIAESTRPFSITLSTVGGFPSERFIRVVWIGVDSDEFIGLHNEVNEALSGMFTKETPSPHLTIARVKFQDPKICDFISNNRSTEIGEMVVDTIRLKKSTLTAKGPIYEDIAVYELKNYE